MNSGDGGRQGAQGERERGGEHLGGRFRRWRLENLCDDHALCDLVAGGSMAKTKSDLEDTHAGEEVIEE